MKRIKHLFDGRPRPLRRLPRFCVLLTLLLWVSLATNATSYSLAMAGDPLLPRLAQLLPRQQTAQQADPAQAPAEQSEDGASEEDIDAADEAEALADGPLMAYDFYLPLLFQTASGETIVDIDNQAIHNAAVTTPLIFEKRVTAGSDDGEERSGGSIALSSSDLELVYDGSTSQVVAVRFTGVTIPKGATLSNAYLQFGVDEVSTSATTLAIQGEATDNAAILTTASFNISRRSRTAASVAWTPAPWPTVGESGVNQRTPNLAAVLQEIINRPGWNSGNAMVILFTGSGRRTAYAYDVRASGAPLLHIEYTTAPVNQAPVANAGADQTIILPALAAINGGAIDDGLPNNRLTFAWSKASGPGEVSFTPANTANIMASFTKAGAYVLRLTVSDGQLTGVDEVAINVMLPVGPITLSKRIAIRQDDAEEQSDGRVLLTTSALQLVMAGTITQTVGLRFSDIAIPPGATIRNAYLQFTAYRANMIATALTIHGEATNNAALLRATAFNLSQRNRTAASVRWTPAPWRVVGESDVNQRTPNLALLLQEMINRPDWRSGNAVAFLLTGSGRRVAYAYEAAPEFAPRLFIEYTMSPENQAPTVNAGVDQTITLPAAATLNGSATDDGLPINNLTFAWSKGSGPGTVTFADASAANTSATFAAAGSYQLRFTVTDGQLSSVDDLQITVNAATAVTFVGAGDIATCGGTADEATALLLDQIPGTVFTLGDNVYNDGSAREFAECYEPSWGRHKARTRPASGNHDYHIPGAADYFAYFGAAAGEPEKGYYSYNLGEWHIIVLNTECSDVGGCTMASPQGQWLQADLAANPRACTLAIWHKPRFTSGTRGSASALIDFWQLLYNAGADVVLNGHDHFYERFARQTPTGVADARYGIRQFTVGTGGAGLYPFGTILPTSEARNNTTYGVLKLTLHAGSYDWAFVPIAGQSYTDSGSAACSTGRPDALSALSSE